MTKKDTWGQTASGVIDYANPKPSQVSVIDIAKGLSREARYCGQTVGDDAYSVAQHSVLASLLVAKEHALYALFHDASEATMRDLSTPLKHLLPEYIRLEGQMQGAIHLAFGLEERAPIEIAKSVKAVDLILMATEKPQLLKDVGHEWSALEGIKALENLHINPMPPKQAEYYFLDRFVSIIHDKPFVKERWLWQEQENRSKTQHYAAELEHDFDADRQPRMRG